MKIFQSKQWQLICVTIGDSPVLQDRGYHVYELQSKFDWFNVTSNGKVLAHCFHIAIKDNDSFVYDFPNKMVMGKIGEFELFTNNPGEGLKKIA